MSNKKPIILVVDDMAKEKTVKDGIANLAEAAGFDKDEVREHVVVITNGEDALTFIEHAKQENMPIAFAFVDNSMQGKKYGVRLASEIKEATPDAEVAWISAEEPSPEEKQQLIAKGFDGNDQKMFNPEPLFHSSLKYNVLNDELSIHNRLGSKSIIHNAVIKPLEQVFQKICGTPQLFHDNTLLNNPVIFSEKLQEKTEFQEKEELLHSIIAQINFLQSGQMNDFINFACNDDVIEFYSSGLRQSDDNSIYQAIDNNDTARFPFNCSLLTYGNRNTIQLSFDAPPSFGGEDREKAEWRQAATLEDIANRLRKLGVGCELVHECQKQKALGNEEWMDVRPSTLALSFKLKEIDISSLRTALSGISEQSAEKLQEIAQQLEQNHACLESISRDEYEGYLDNLAQAQTAQNCTTHLGSLMTEAAAKKIGVPVADLINVCDHKFHR